MYYKKVKITKIYRWRDVKDGDLKALRWVYWLGTKKRDERAYEALMDDYIKVFGLSETFLKKWEVKKKLADAYMKYLSATLDNKKVLNKIRVLEMQIKALEEVENEEKTLSVGQMVANIRKNGGQIDERRDTIYTLENLIRSYGE